MGSKDNCNGLANRPLRGRFKARIGHVSRSVCVFKLIQIEIARIHVVVS
jgi:hypothetical protein